jgi:purine-binding chemotaxis protein CheW
MNKKSKIKTTLDSLFTGGKIKPEEPKVEEEDKTVAIKPTSNDTKNETDQPVRKAPESRNEEAKPVENSKPVVELPVEFPKPAISEPVLQTPKPGSVKEILLEVQTKQVEMKQPVVPIETSQPNKEEVDSDEQLVIFSLGKELYGVTIHSVESIIKIQAITEVPRTASYILGVTNLRGTVVPVLDLRKRFNLQFAETTPNTRIIIVNAEGSKVGIVVDEVTEVLKVAQHSIQPPPPMSTTIESAFISGIAKINDRLVILLDLEKVLASSTRKYDR